MVSTKTVNYVILGFVLISLIVTAYSTTILITITPEIHIPEDVLRKRDLSDIATKEDVSHLAKTGDLGVIVEKKDIESIQTDMVEIREMIGEIELSMPTPTPSPTPTPTPKPKPPQKIPKILDVKVELGSSKGFNLTTRFYEGKSYTAIVLPKGGKGSVPITLTSWSSSDYTISPHIAVVGELDFIGVNYTIDPSVLRLKGDEQAESILEIEADLEAPTAYYEISTGGYVEERGAGFGGENIHMLVFPYTPTCIFYVNLPVPPNRTSTPTFQLSPNMKIDIMFFMRNVQDPISLDVDVPQFITFEVDPKPLEVIPRPTTDKIYLLTITASENPQEGTHKIVVTGHVGVYDFERAFYIEVVRQ